MAEASERTVDQRRVFGGQTFVIEAIFGKRAGLEVLDHDVGAARKTPYEFSTFRFGEVDGDGLLVAIGG